MSSQLPLQYLGAVTALVREQTLTDSDFCVCVTQLKSCHATHSPTFGAQLSVLGIKISFSLQDTTALFLQRILSLDFSY